MQQVPVEEKVELVTPYLQRAGMVAGPLSEAARAKVAHVLTAAGDRIKTAGDVTNYTEFFVADDRLPCDEQAFAKHLRRPGAAELLREYRDRLAAAESFDAPALDRLTHEFVAAKGIKIGEIIHAIRVSVTGKSIGMGLFDCLAILGRASSLARIDRALEKV
jgi:glutamyl-tRNA synthetase